MISSIQKKEKVNAFFAAKFFVSLSKSIKISPTRMIEYLLPIGISLLSFVSVGVGIVALNVLYQLFGPRDPSKPPVVFHYVPILGCAVSYGMDPYKFLFDCRDKVSFSYYILHEGKKTRDL